MLVDRILDRQDGFGYYVDEFRDYLEDEYEDFTCGKPLLEAFENEDNESIKKWLCEYITEMGFNEEICDYINSQDWLSCDEEHKIEDEKMNNIIRTREAMILKKIGAKKAEINEVLDNNDLFISISQDLCYCKELPYLPSNAYGLLLSKLATRPDCSLCCHPFSEIYDEFVKYGVLDYARYMEQKFDVKVYGVAIYYDYAFGISFDILYLDTTETNQEFSETLAYFKKSGELLAHAINTKIPEYSEDGYCYFNRVGNGIARYA